jgi:hypothetical protein
MTHLLRIQEERNTGILVKDEGKVIPMLFLTEHHAMKVYWGNGGIAPFIL